MFKKLLCGAALLSVATFSNAAVMTITETASVGLTTTNFDEVVSVNQFDSSLGDLLSVTFSLEGFVEANARLESEDAAPAVVTTEISVTLTLTETILDNTLVVTVPSLSEVFNASAFDGSVDFGGTSGITYEELTATDTETNTFNDGATLALFTGLGTVDLNLNALAVSFASGAGNLITQFQTAAGGNIEVVYEYRVPSVSAPSHLALLGLGLVAFAGMRRKA